MPGGSSRSSAVLALPLNFMTRGRRLDRGGRRTQRLGHGGASVSRSPPTKTTSVSPSLVRPRRSRKRREGDRDEVGHRWDSDLAARTAACGGCGCKRLNLIGSIGEPKRLAVSPPHFSPQNDRLRRDRVIRRATARGQIAEPCSAGELARLASMTGRLLPLKFGGRRDGVSHGSARGSQHDRRRMSLVETYIFRIVRSSFLVALGVLTAVIWVTQALKEFDLLTTKGPIAAHLPRRHGAGRCRPW